MNLPERPACSARGAGRGQTEVADNAKHDDPRGVADRQNSQHEQRGAATPDRRGAKPDQSSAAPDALDAGGLGVCPLCGNALSGVHCKLICDRCGYREDCSDLFPV